MIDRDNPRHQDTAGCILLILGSLVLFWMGQALDLFLASTPWWVLLLLAVAVVYVVEVFGKDFFRGRKS
jgi:membrane protein implicated in regulation of membrane protease activity